MIKLLILLVLLLIIGVTNTFAIPFILNTEIPMPPTVILLGTGFVGLAVVGRK